MKGCNDSAISDLFKISRSSQAADKKPEFHLSFFEIYSGKVFDLLPRDSPGNQRVLLQLLEDGK